MATEEDRITLRSVWLLEDGLTLNDVLWRRDLTYWAPDSSWDWWRPYQPPFELDDNNAGTGIAYVPNPAAWPENGWVFVLQGDDTRNFWVFYPETGTWEAAPSVPEEVEDGGKICYGGIHFIGPGAHPFALLYVFTGNWHENGPYYLSHFYRYIFVVGDPSPPRKGDSLSVSPAEGRWERLADMPGRAREEAGFTWVPMSPEGHTPYPMGLVVVLKNTEDNSFGYFLCYDPLTDCWLTNIGSPEIPTLKDGTCMTAHFRDSTVLVEGTTSANPPWYYGYYDIINNTVYRTHSTPQPPHAGSAIAAMIPNTDGIAYAEFGKDNFGYLYALLPPPYQEGSQGIGANLASGVKVKVNQNRGSHLFSVKCTPGVVKLSIMDVAGRRLTSITADCQKGKIDIAWDHPTIQSGVYLWTISTSSGGTNGKLVITK